MTSVVRKQPGLQSRLVRCDDGKLYELDYLNPQGPNVLANEAIGAMLIRGLGGLPMPPWKPVAIDLRWSLPPRVGDANSQP